MALYEDLMSLCSTPDSPFYFKDFLKDGIPYRIFNYRLASYTDFTKQCALECRGTMYAFPNDYVRRRVACRPMPKFFNLNENPFTMNLDHSKIVDFMDKADGSLISTFWHNDQLALKTKGSLDAEQIALAWDYINRHPALKGELQRLTSAQHTVNMEVVSPLNRIVLPYQETSVKILNVREHSTGKMYFKRDFAFSSSYGLSQYWIDLETIEAADKAKFVESIPDMVDIEGFVLRYSDGKLVKVKTNWYLTLHHTKDSVTIPRRLFECVILETTDDLKEMFHNDPTALGLIEDMEKTVIPKYNRMIKMVENFYELYKNLDRKSYAIKGQSDLGDYFSLGMTKYLYEKGLKGDGPDYKAFAIKNYKSFGIEDIEEMTDNS